MSRTVGIGLLGAGWMGDLHAASYRRVADHFPDCGATPRFVAAADEVPQRAEDAARRLGFERASTNWRDVVADPAVEALSITAPNHVHEEMARAAAEAGKHFWIEKPAGRFPVETQAIADAAGAAGVLTMVGYNYRQAPAVLHAKRLLDEGAVGEVNHYRGVFLTGYASHPQGALSWRFRRDVAGLGTLGDLMSHVANMAEYLCGPVEQVAAQEATFVTERPIPVPGQGTHFSVVEGAELGPVENEDYVSGLARFAGGARGTLEASRVVVGPRVRMAFEVNGTGGALRWNFERMNELEVYLDGPTGADAGYSTIHVGPEHPYFGSFQPGAGIPMGYNDLKVIEAYRFLQSLADGEQAEPGIADAARTARLLEAMHASAQSGGWETVGA